MALEHPRGVLRGLLVGGTRDHLDLAEEFAQLLERNRPRTKQAGTAGHGEVEDRGFDAVGAGAAVDDPWATLPEGITHVRGLGGADVAERIGTRRGERASGETEHLAEERMGRNPDRHGILTRRDEIRHDGLAAQHDRQRTRPERSEECETRIGLGDFGERGLLEDVDDERVEERTALDREDLGERGGISRVGGEAVDRLGRQGHAGALTQELGRPRKVGGSGGQETGGGRRQRRRDFTGRTAGVPSDLPRDAGGGNLPDRQQKGRLKRRPGKVIAEAITSS